MVIKSITIENFKGIADPVTINFKPITLLFGPNSAGKSTIIQALHYLREVIERENINPSNTLAGGQAIDLGGFYSLVHNHDLQKSIIIRLDLDLTDTDLTEFMGDLRQVEHVPPSSDWDISPLFKDIKTAWVEVKINRTASLIGAIIEEYKVGINGDIIGCINCSNEGKNIYISLLDLQHPLFKSETTIFDFDVKNSILELVTINIKESMLSDESHTNLGLLGLKSALPGKGLLTFIDDIWIELNGQSLVPLEFPRKALIDILSVIFVGPLNASRELLKNTCYLGPDRTVPSRNFEPPLTPDESRWSNGLAAWDILHRSEQGFIDKVNNWLGGENHLNSGYKVRVSRFKEIDSESPLGYMLYEDNSSSHEEWQEKFGEMMELYPNTFFELFDSPTRTRLYLIKEDNHIELLPSDIGYGISKVIPVLVAPLYQNTGIVAIEEPESNIHPAFQVVLGDLFASQIQEKKDIMFLIETHSEHLVLRLMRRMRETSLNSLPPGMPATTPEDVAIYYVSSQDSKTCIQLMAVSKQGALISSWPGGFFEEGFKELFG